MKSTGPQKCVSGTKFGLSKILAHMISGASDRPGRSDFLGVLRVKERILGARRVKEEILGARKVVEAMKKQGEESEKINFSVIKLLGIDLNVRGDKVKAIRTSHF